MLNDVALAMEYILLHRQNKFMGTTILNYLDTLKSLFQQYNVKTALDYGCGQAIPHKNGEVKEKCGVKFSLYDPYVGAFCKLPSGTFDAVVCIDVLEHIPENQLDNTFKKIFDRADKIAIFTFCNRLAKKLFSDGSNVHITLKDEAQWLNRLQPFNFKDLPLYLMETP